MLWVSQEGGCGKRFLSIGISLNGSVVDDYAEPFTLANDINDDASNYEIDENNAGAMGIVC